MGSTLLKKKNLKVKWTVSEVKLIIYMYMCTCVYMYIYTHTHTYIKLCKLLVTGFFFLTVFSVTDFYKMKQLKSDDGLCNQGNFVVYFLT